MLQRIYGTAFGTKEALDAHLRNLEDARRRDHRLLGRQLGIFLVDEDAGGGLIYWQPRGAVVKKVIERFWEDEHVKRGLPARLHPPHRAGRSLQDLGAL